MDRNDDNNTTTKNRVVPLNAHQKAEIEQGVKNKIKRKRNRPDLAKFGQEYVEPGDNSTYLRYARVAMDLPPIDINDPKQVQKRIEEYFDFCEQNDRKPQMVGMANWLGVSRDTLNTWKRGDFRNETHTPIILRAVGLLEELWVDYMQDGKINPANGIFLAKNMFQYKDVQDVVIAPQNNSENDLDVDAITKRYQLDDGKTIPTTFVDDPKNN